MTGADSIRPAARSYFYLKLESRAAMDGRFEIGFVRVNEPKQYRNRPDRL